MTINEIDRKENRLMIYKSISARKNQRECKCDMSTRKKGDNQKFIYE